MEENLKQLLLKDLCARLPYGVKVETPYNTAKVIGIVNRQGVKKDIDYIDIVTDRQTYPIRYIQSYLRPMSSMTEEERKEYQKIKDNISYVNGWLNYHIVDDWLNKNMFDYRNLIEKGLALKAKEGMYNLKD